MTDANGYDIMERDVFRLGNAAFSSSFVPVDSSISISDYQQSQTFTVWNDRPQGGSVHSDGTLLINVQRYVSTIDNGGLPSHMYGSTSFPSKKTFMHFQLKTYNASKQGKWQAVRKRNLLAVKAKGDYKVTKPDWYASNLLESKTRLVQQLKDLSVNQISFTCLHDVQMKIRVRLDYLHIKDNIFTKGKDLATNQDLASLAKAICAVMQWA